MEDEWEWDADLRCLGGDCAERMPLRVLTLRVVGLEPPKLLADALREPGSGGTDGTDGTMRAGDGGDITDALELGNGAGETNEALADGAVSGLTCGTRSSLYSREFFKAKSMGTNKASSGTMTSAPRGKTNESETCKVIGFSSS